MALNTESADIILSKYFSVPETNADYAKMIELRRSLWGRGNEYLSDLCHTIDTQALHDAFGPWDTPSPQVPSFAGQDGSLPFHFSSPHDIAPEDYAIPPDRTFTFLDVSRIPFVPGRLSHILIRDEYGSTFEYLCSMPRDACGGVTICGQPGIGKSLFLYYVLIRRLLLGLPIALQVAPEEVLLFLESGTYLIRDQDTMNFIPGDIWALVDFSSGVGQPALFLTYPSPSFFIVQAASFRAEDMDWHRDKNGEAFYMRPWGWDEIVFGALYQPRPLPTLKGLRFVFDLFGPSARMCYTEADNYTSIAQRVMKIKADLRGVQHSPLRQLHRDMASAPANRISHQVFCIYPHPKFRSLPCHDFSSKYMGRLVLDCWAAKDEERLGEMRDFFSRFPVPGPAAGCLFEQFVHSTLPHGFEGPIHALPINPGVAKHWGYDTNTRDATYNTHFEPRTSTIIDMKRLSAPTENEYYIPVRENQAAFDSLVIHNGRVTLFQVVVNCKYDVLATSLNQLEKVLPRPSYDLVFVVRKGRCASGVVPNAWKDKLRLFVMELGD
ncbi:hypothetical protein BOTBODRAFT_55303 [Botryobasidium botryosum FD-172 SS1]|uniref:Crinkler (CRN) family protein n=1 Tax=Botryobasidium botryosum (strain FD-172 SS1) TaxID=930990 RepID=A0A067MRG2_BOTB1|nr:hypothetical protein BOTBODRAFT_55303 [Botryobasidium botryosum FD-172 SS1]